MGSIYFSKRIFKKRPKPGEPAPERPKAFKSAAAAEAWAKKNKLKNFKVQQIADKKFKIRTHF